MLDRFLSKKIIKTQHNVKSNLKKYRANIVRIMHEHILIWKKVC